MRKAVCGSIPNDTCRIYETTSVACLEYDSMSKYLAVGKVLAFAMRPDFDVVAVGSPGVNKKVNAASARWEGPKDFVLYILDNPFGSSSCIFSDSELSTPIFLSPKKAFASRWSCSKVN